MVRIWKFEYLSPSDEAPQEESFHETADAAYKAACKYLLEQIVGELDLSDEGIQTAMYSLLSAIDCGDYRNAVEVYSKLIESEDWDESVTVYGVPLVPEYKLDIVEAADDFRNLLENGEVGDEECADCGSTECDGSCTEDEDEDEDEDSDEEDEDDLDSDEEEEEEEDE